MIYQLRRWLPTRELVVVGDNSYAVLDFLHVCQQLTHPVTIVTRLRLDAALYEPAPSYSEQGRLPKKGRRLPTLATLLTADTTHWVAKPFLGIKVPGGIWRPPLPFGIAVQLPALHSLGAHP